MRERVDLSNRASAAVVRRGDGVVLKAAALSLAATALGLSRFGYAVLLPAMRAELNWSYTQAGLMNAANALGYLAGAACAIPTTAGFGLRRTFAISFALTALSLLACGFTTSYPVLVLLRLIGGVAGAILFIAGATLASRLAGSSTSSGFVVGVFFAGVGPGILLSAALMPMALESHGGWRIGWEVMGVVAAVSCVAGVWLTRTPRDASDSVGPVPAGLGGIGVSIAAFTLFGFGYISYMTFIVAYYRQAGRTVADIAIFWATLGVAATASGWAWRRLLDRSSSTGALAILLGVVTLGAALPLASQRQPVLLASAVLFGIAFLSVSAALTQLLRRTLAPSQWTRGLSVSMTLFGLGQVLAPVVTGQLADISGSLEVGLAISTGILAIATVIATFQRRAWKPLGSPR